MLSLIIIYLCPFYIYIKGLFKININSSQEANYPKIL